MGHTKSSCGFWREFRLKDRHCAVDKAHPNSAHDSSHDHMCPSIGSGLKQGSDDHDDHPYANGLLSSNCLPKDGGRDGSEETSYFVNGYNQTSDCSARSIERIFERR